ncbi:hypothetical protein AtNW77_Chr4g0283461 [Arabidopsis thaliana]
MTTPPTYIYITQYGHITSLLSLARSESSKDLLSDLSIPDPSKYHLSHVMHLWSYIRKTKDKG